jgi:transcriptional regulator with PAS, ATPase and Fis domain
MTSRNIELVGVIATFSNFYRTMKKVSKNMGIEVIIKMGAFRQSTDVAGDLIKEYGVGVIISRGMTGRFLEQHLDIPVVVVEITSFDLLKAYYEVKEYSENILFVDVHREKYYYEIDVVEKILGMKVKREVFTELKEIDGILREAKDNGVKMIVATAECVVDLAKKLGMCGIMIDTTEKDIREALLSAINTLRYMRHARESDHWMKTVINSMDDGLISVEHTGIIRQINLNAKMMLGLDGIKVIGKNILEVAHFNAELLEFMAGRTAYSGKVIAFGETQMVLSRTPIYIESMFIGTYIKVQKSNVIQELESKVRRNLHQKGLVAKATFDDIIGESQLVADLKRRARAFAKYNATILIQGESGTGKELFAQSIHNGSPRRKEAFVAINCAALSENLLESELFGYDEGAFTGAKRGGKAGLFELAHGGTIFLDEISGISPKLQAKLLRVIQEKEIMRVGSDHIIPVDVRILCASNRDLREKVQQGDFRDDLYYRINTLMLFIPPLCEHKEDIASIARNLAEKKNRLLGSEIELTGNMLQMMTHHVWHGNVREMDGFIERFIILSLEMPDKSVTNRQLLFARLLREVGQREKIAAGNGAVFSEENILVVPGTLKEIEEQVVNAYLRKFNGNRSKVCKTLGISKTTMWRKYLER